MLYSQGIAMEDLGIGHKTMDDDEAHRTPVTAKGSSVWFCSLMVE
jgi:hypothetical protein